MLKRLLNPVPACPISNHVAPHTYSPVARYPLPSPNMMVFTLSPATDSKQQQSTQLPSQSRRHSIGLADGYGRQILTSRQLNKVVQEVFSSRDSKRVNKASIGSSSKSKKVMTGKNVLKPSVKPMNISGAFVSTAQSKPANKVHNIQVSTKKYLKIQGGQQNKIEVENFRHNKGSAINGSTDLIVHPYRDKSTDSYHYGYGYGYTPFPKDMVKEGIISGRSQVNEWGEMSVPPFPGKLIENDEYSSILTKSRIENLPKLEVNLSDMNGVKESDLHLSKLKNAMEANQTRQEYLSEATKWMSQEKSSENQRLNSPNQNDEDKWDRLLRIRQKYYCDSQEKQESASGLKVCHQMGTTEVKTTIKGGIEEMNKRSTQSFQSSGTKSKEKVFIKTSEVLTFTDHREVSPHPHYNRISSPVHYINNCFESNSSSQRLGGQIPKNISQIQPRITNDMKYSYSFEEPAENLFKVDKSLFHKFLNSQQLEWMLIYQHMVQHVEGAYLGDARNPDANLVTFVKIGDDGVEVFNNRILAHYIGVWLISMGFQDASVKQRVIDNVELMFTDTSDNPVDSICEQNHQNEREGNIKQIAELMYNNLLFGYLPSSLQMQALLNTCKRGWEYFTLLICKILRLLIKQNRKAEEEPNIIQMQGLLSGLEEAVDGDLK